MYLCKVVEESHPIFYMKNGMIGDAHHRYRTHSQGIVPSQFCTGDTESLHGPSKLDKKIINLIMLRFSRRSKLQGSCAASLPLDWFYHGSCYSFSVCFSQVTSSLTHLHPPRRLLLPVFDSRECSAFVNCAAESSFSWYVPVFAYSRSVKRCAIQGSLWYSFCRLAICGIH